MQLNEDERHALNQAEELCDEILKDLDELPSLIDFPDVSYCIGQIRDYCEDALANIDYAREAEELPDCQVGGIVREV